MGQLAMLFAWWAMISLALLSAAAGTVVAVFPTLAANLARPLAGCG